MSRSSATLLGLPLLAGCLITPVVNTNGPTAELTPWGTVTGDNGSGAGGYTPRVGPIGAPWADADTRPRPYVPQSLGSGNTLEWTGIPLIVLDGVAYWNAPTLHAVDLATNTTAWSATEPLNGAGVFAHAGSICVAAGSALHCKRIATGEAAPTVSLLDPDDTGTLLVAKPAQTVVADGMAYVSVSAGGLGGNFIGSLVAVDLSDHTQAWRTSVAPSFGRTVAVLGDDVVYVGEECGDGPCLLAVDRVSGEEVARRPYDGPGVVFHAGDDEVVFVEVSGGTPLAATFSTVTWDGTAFTDSTAAWSDLFDALPTLEMEPLPTALVGPDSSGVGYVSAGQQICAVDFAEPEQKWCTHTGTSTYGAFRAYQDRVVYFNDAHRQGVLDAETGADQDEPVRWIYEDQVFEDDTWWSL